MFGLGLTALGVPCWMAKYAGDSIGGGGDINDEMLGPRRSVDCSRELVSQAVAGRATAVAVADAGVANAD